MQASASQNVIRCRRTVRENYRKNGLAMLWRAFIGANKGNRTTVSWAY